MNIKNCLPSYIKCGQVYETNLPDNLDKSEAPIVLGQVDVNTNHIPNPSVLIKFSEFINFTLVGLNPKINIIYRLVRKDKCLDNAEILQEWEFEFESARILEIANLDTKQPTVLNYCDSLDECVGNKLTYSIEIVQIKTNNVKAYSIVNKSITATVISKAFECGNNYLPYIKQGKVFNQVLPISLTKDDKPVLLTSTSINQNSNNAFVLINFSCFITSILKEDDFNELTFRLVKIYNDCKKEVLREWPFKRVFVNDTNIKEPLVYNYCECLSSRCNLYCRYAIELVEAKLSKNSYYDITQKSMTAQVYYGQNQQGIY